MSTEPLMQATFLAMTVTSGAGQPHQQLVLQLVEVSKEAVVDVQRGELLLVDAHHVLGLRRDQLLLHLAPRHRLQARVRDLERRVVEALDVPELEHVVHHHDQPRHPEQAADEDEHLGEEAHVVVADRSGDVIQRHLAAVIGLQRLVPEEDGVVDTLGQEDREEHHEYELQ